MRWKTFLLLIGSFVALSVLSSAYTSAGTTSGLQVDLAEGVGQPQPQSTSQRAFRQPRFTESYCLEGVVGGSDDDPVDLYGPFMVKTGAEGALFVLDYGDLRIKEFSADGEYRGLFGHGRGQGPGELMSATDFYIDDEGSVHVADFLAAEIEVFASDGSHAKTTKLEEQPYRLMPGEQGRQMIMRPLYNAELFGELDAQGAVPNPFGRFVQDRMGGLALDGLVVPVEGNRFLFVPQLVGWLATFDFDGDMELFVETLDPLGFPEVQRDGDGNMWVERGARLNAHSASVIDGQIYLLRGTRSGSRLSDLVDVYDLDGGTYRYSFETPKPALETVMTPSGLFQVDSTTICRWTMDEV